MVQMVQMDFLGRMELTVRLLTYTLNIPTIWLLLQQMMEKPLVSTWDKWLTLFKKIAWYLMIIHGH